MCVIAASPAGTPQPSEKTLRTMFARNPHGAGYMYARAGKVHICKGFMTQADFIRAVKAERFTAADPVVYHCRISTQAGVNPAMTQPFPLTARLTAARQLDYTCSIGLAHNGIIRLTSDPFELEYSDTALFIARYAARLLRNQKDAHNPGMLEAIETLTQSRWAILTGDGEIETIGRFIDGEDGNLYSNGTYQSFAERNQATRRPPFFPEYKFD